MNLLAFLVVGAGGALGALTRSKATGLLSPITPKGFPWPTLIINITACFIAGASLAAQTAIDPTLYLALTMGFLGGFSTLSSMNYEAVDLFLDKRFAAGTIYLAATYASTLGAAALGFAALSMLV